MFVGKRQIWLFLTVGQECGGGVFSEQTRWAGTMMASKFDLSVESAGPSSHLFSSTYNKLGRLSGGDEGSETVTTLGQRGNLAVLKAKGLDGRKWSFS